MKITPHGLIPISVEKAKEVPVLFIEQGDSCITLPINSLHVFIETLKIESEKKP